MRTTLISAAFAALALAPLAVLAEGPNYNYAEVGYLSFNLDDGPTVDGFGAAASYGITPHIHVLATLVRVVEELEGLARQRAQGKAEPRGRDRK